VYTNKGIAQKRKTAAIRLLALILFISGAYRLKSSGLGLKDLKELLRKTLHGGVATIVQLWALIKEQIASRWV